MVGLGVGVVAVGWLMACVGDTPTTTPVETDSGTGSSSGSTSSSGSSSAGCNFTAKTPSEPKIACGAGPLCTTTCCIGQTTDPKCDGACSSPDDTNFACDSRYQCNGSACCMALSKQLVTTGTCPYGVVSLDVSAVACVPSGCDRGSFQYEMCRQDSDCSQTGDRCFRISVNAKLEYGVCL